MKTVLLLALGVLSCVQANAQDYTSELSAIQAIESSNGLNVDHPVIQTGMHTGTRAGGFYGIMPITAREVISLNPKRFAKWTFLLTKSNEQITEALNNDRQLDRALATFMWKKLRETRSVGEAACAWYRGAYAKTCKQAAFRKDCEYTQKFKAILKVAAHP